MLSTSLALELRQRELDVGLTPDHFSPRLTTIEWLMEVVQIHVASRLERRSPFCR